MLCRYVHRVGRTARMGQQGEAILFLLPAEIGYLGLLTPAGCSIAEMDLDAVMRALPAVPNQSAVSPPIPSNAVGQSVPA